MAFCYECGAELEEGMKFCMECGTPIDDSVVESNPNKETVIEDSENGESVGNVNTDSDSIEINGTSAMQSFTSNVKLLDKQLQNTETQKKDAKFKDKLRLKKEQHKIEEQLVDKIESFDIPDNKEDYIAFMKLAYINIMKCEDADGYFDYDNEVGNAWYEKAQQLYKVSQSFFGKDSDFGEIESFYKKITERVDD